MSGGNGRRRDFLRAAASTLVAPGVCLAAAEPWRNPQRVTLALAARQSLDHLPLTLAEQLGFFRQAGLQIEWMVHESGAKALASAVQGHADVVAAAYDHLLGLQHRGLNFQAFVLTGRTPQLSLGVASRRDLPSMLALKGARFGVASLDASTHWLTCQWLLQNGLLPEDVVFVEVGTSALAVEALRSGAIDALCQPDPVMYGLEQRNEVRVVGDARTLMATRKLMGGAVPGGCLFTRTEFLQRQPELFQALSDAVVHALKWLQTAGLTDILKTVPTAHWSGDRAHYLGAFEKLRESYALDGVIASDAVLNAWHAHARLPGRAVLPRQGLAQTYTNAFALKSKSRFSA